MAPLFQQRCSFELLTRFFRLADHLQVQATSRVARNICLEEAVWTEIASQEFSGFGLCHSLLKPSGWKALARLFRETKQVQVKVDRSPCIHFDESTLQKLIGMLRSARQSASSPNSFLGVMRFPRGSLPPTLDDGRRRVSNNAQTPADPQSGIGEAFSLPLTLPDNTSSVESSSVSEQPTALTLHFGWQGNHLYAAVCDDDSLPRALGPEAEEVFCNSLHISMQRGCPIIFLDIAACSPAMTLHHRSVCIIVNGPWSKCNTGMFFMKAGSDATIDAFVTGIPCVVCAHRAQARDFEPIALVPALHLDKVRR